MKENDTSIADLLIHIEKLRGLIDYHILTASKYITDIHSIEKIIEERTKENESSS